MKFRSKGIDVSRETSLEGLLVLDELVDEIGKVFKGGRRSHIKMNTSSG
jgi:hypothetical protein